MVKGGFLTAETLLDIKLAHPSKNITQRQLTSQTPSRSTPFHTLAVSPGNLTVVQASCVLSAGAITSATSTPLTYTQPSSTAPDNIDCM